MKLSSTLSLVLLALALISLALAPSMALAQPTAVLNRYAAAETVDDDWHLSRPGRIGHLRFGAQLQLDWAVNPLVYENELGMAGSERFSVVEHQVTTTLGLHFGLWDRLLVFGMLPVTVAMEGDAESSRMEGIAAPDGAGTSDLVLGLRGRLFGEDDDAGSLAAQLSATLPTAAPGPIAYRGEDHVTFLGELLGEVRPGAGSRVTMNLGVRLREEDELTTTSNLEFRHELTFGLGFAIPVYTDSAEARTHLDVGAQLYGSTALAFAFEREHTPLEALGGVKFFHATGTVAGLSGGLGLVRGFGSPDFRLVAMVGWAMPDELEPEAAEPTDRDGDGLMDPDDECPDQPEDRDQWQDDDGCPDPDNDGDGILDEPDECPNEPENLNDWEDDDGCPEEVGDADNDGILDNLDRCPQDPEDVDEFDDEDGCPDPDNDDDGVLDASDQCRDEPGPVANHGCPDSDRDGDTVVDRSDNCPDEPGTVENHGCAERQQVVIEQDRLEILDHVYFRTNRATIQRRSYELLMNVARVLSSHPEITRIIVEGHTDSRGRAEYNRRLSQERAEAVVEFLVRRGGLTETRLEARGFGPDQPVVENATSAEDHARNRRVEFRIPGATGIEQRAGGPSEETIDR